MNKELVKKIAIYGGIGIGSLVVIGVTASVIRNRRFSGKGKGQGQGAGLGNKNEIIGKTINTTGSSAYLRSTPEIPATDVWTDCAWYDAICAAKVLAGYDTSISKANVVGTIKGNAGGVKIKNVVVGKDGYNWYLLENAEVGGFAGTSIKRTGYVREDVVSVNFN